MDICMAIAFEGDELIIMLEMELVGRAGDHYDGAAVVVAADNYDGAVLIALSALEIEPRMPDLPSLGSVVTHRCRPSRRGGSARPRR